MAKAFKFELQDVLEFRNLEKEQAQNELAKALAVETQIQNDLQTIAAQFLSVQKQLDSYTDFEDIAAGNRRKVLLDLQKEGKNRMDYKSFINGNQNILGQKLK